MTVAFSLALASLLALAIGALLLRTVGSGVRLGRLLAGTSAVSIDEALELGRSGTTRYVRISGRITSDEEFPDDQDRPLVFRRTRVQIKDVAKDAWQTIVDEREAVPFAIETRSSSIGVDEAALDDGLIVIPRESVGRVRDLPTDLAVDVPAGTTPDQPARLVIQQLSAVEHATVCGTSTMRAGLPLMTAAPDRPLIVTTLDQPAAMRLLAGGRRRRVMIAAFALAVGLGLLAAALVAVVVG